MPFSHILTRDEIMTTPGVIALGITVPLWLMSIQEILATISPVLGVLTLIATLVLVVMKILREKAEKDYFKELKNHKIPIHRNEEENKKEDKKEVDNVD